jgi:hypothetical protein
MGFIGSTCTALPRHPGAGQLSGSAYLPSARCLVCISPHLPQVNLTVLTRGLMGATRQGLTLVHVSAQPVPFSPLTD